MGVHKKLTEKLEAETAERIAAAQSEMNSELHIAKLWDAATERTGYTGIAPWIIHTSKLYGKIGTLAFKDVIPQDALALLDTFPPVPTVHHYDGTYKTIRPAVAAKEGATVTPIDGAVIRMDGGPEYGQKTKLEWVADFDGELIELDVELRAVHEVIPRIGARVTYYPEGRVKRVEECNTNFPIAKDLPKLKEIRYSRGTEQSFNSFVCYGERVGDVRKHVAAWAAECFRRKRNSRAAYEAALASPPVVEYHGVPYEREPLKGGTKRQWECLHTPVALSDQEIAKQHWQEYAADTRNIPAACPVQPSEYDKFFSYYVWAAAWLFRHGLLDDDQHVTNGKPYRYGSAWL